MAKKKEVVINPKAAPADIESGDVNILYHHTLIGSLSDDGQARLETENTICLHDIGVEYKKPRPETVTIPVYVKVGDNTPFAVDPITGIPGAEFAEYLDESGQFENKTVASARFIDSNGSLPPITFFGLVNINRNGELGVNCYVPDSIPAARDRLLITLE